MADYIERRAVQEILKKHSIGTCRGIPCYPEEIKFAAKDVNNLPAADVAPVRRGRWEEIISPYGELEGWICECGRESNAKDNYCPNCGAKMDGGKDDG